MPHTQLNDSLSGFLNREPTKTEDFVAEATPLMRRMSRRAAPWLPEDRHEEVVNQTYVNLLTSSPSSFDSATTSAKNFIRRKLFNAIRQVAESYRSPGQTSRGRVYGGAEVQTERMDATLNPRGVRVKKRFASVISTDAENFPEPISPFGAETIEAACDAATILEMAPPVLAAALWLRYFEGYTGAETAEMLRISRAGLYAQMADFARPFRAAA